MTFFKKYDPRIALADSRGRHVPFVDIGSQWGLLATEDNYLISELRRAQAEHRGGVMEITHAEYEELKKNEIPIRRIWRETVGRLQLKRLYARANANAVAGRRLPPGVEIGVKTKILARPQGISDIVVKACQR